MCTKTKVTKINEDGEVFYLFEKDYTDVIEENPVNSKAMDYFLGELKDYPVPMDVADVDLQANGTSEEKIKLAKRIKWERVCGIIVGGRRVSNYVNLKVKPEGPMKEAMEKLIEDDDLAISFRGLCNIRYSAGKNFAERFNIISITTFEVKSQKDFIAYPTDEDVIKNKHKYT